MARPSLAEPQIQWNLEAEATFDNFRVGTIPRILWSTRFPSSAGSASWCQIERQGHVRAAGGASDGWTLKMKQGGAGAPPASGASATPDVLNATPQGYGRSFLRRLGAVYMASVAAWTAGEVLLLAGEGQPDLGSWALIVLRNSALLGAIPAIAATLAMTAWRQVRNTSPLVIAMLFVVLLNLSWGTAALATWGHGPPASMVENVYFIATAVVGVGGIAVSYAWTRHPAVALAAGSAAFAIVFIPGPYFLLYTQSSTTGLRFMALMSFAAVCSAWFYLRSEQRIAKHMARAEVLP